MYPIFKRHTLACWVFFVLLAAAVWLLLHFYPLMPDPMASHFGAGGEPNGWSSKDSFFVVLGVMLAFSAALFFGMALAVPGLPPGLVNVPHRDYWLAPERRQETYGILVGFLLWFGNATVAFLILVTEQTFRANLEPPHRLGSGFFLGLVAYFVFAIGATVVLIVRFRKPSG